MPGFFRAWLYYLNPITWLIAGLVTNELHDLEITCLDGEFRTIEPPGGQSCEQWMGAYVGAAGGYLRNPGDSAACQYCQYSVGDQLTDGLDITYSDRGLYLVYFLMYSIVRPRLPLSSPTGAVVVGSSALTPCTLVPCSSTASSPSSAHASSRVVTRSAEPARSSTATVVVVVIVVVLHLQSPFPFPLAVPPCFLLPCACTFPSFLSPASYSKAPSPASVPASRRLERAIPSLVSSTSSFVAASLSLVKLSENPAG